ncbi:TPA: DnaB-like helicase N-terminal domain-containing protein, partial [Yersinia enterocolitica]
MTVDYKTPPHNLDAEQSVLGGLMLDDGSDNVAKVLSMLKPESFYTRPHQVIFAEIKDLVSRQIPIDLLTLFNQMENKGISSTVGGFAYMAELSKNTPSAANIVHYAMEVRDKAITRYSIAKTNAMTELLYANNGMTATQKLEAIQALSTEITDHAKTGNRRGLRTFESVFSDWVDVVEQRLSGDPRAVG